ncbi:MAG TPA: DUF433 domain-containing protein [Ginsengibacter sp.]
MPTATFHKQQLGAGIYTVSDISTLLSIPKFKVRRYLNEYWNERSGKKLFNETYSWSVDNKIKAVNFYTLIELYTCFHLQELGVTPKEILKSRTAMMKDLKIPYPFASEVLLTNGKKIWFEFKDSIVKADGSKQTDFVEFIQQFASKIEFNSNKIAEKFWPAGKQSDVVINPHNQFGQPILNGTNINAEVIFSMYESGEPIEAIGILYDLTKKQVNDAISFYKKSAA